MQKIIEPFAPAVRKRLWAIEELERHGIPTAVRLKPVLPFDFSDVKDIVATVQKVTSGSIVVQGVDLRLPYMIRLARIAQAHYPEKLSRWMTDIEAIKEERLALVEFLKGHERVDYCEVDEVIHEVDARFGRES